MIVPKKLSWLRILFRYQGTAFERIKWRVFFVTATSILVTVGDLQYHLFHYDLTSKPFSLIGLALGIFLGFRNNTSYDRFWEGRKLWGRMVNTSRSITRQILTLVGQVPIGRGEDSIEVDPKEIAEFQRRCIRRVIAYVHAVRLHLRDQRFDELERILPAEEVAELNRSTNAPIAILQRLGNDLRMAWDDDWIFSMHLPTLEASLTDFTDIQGGCERIKATPIPFSYTTLIHRIVAIYCFALPFGLVNEVGTLTPVVVMIIAYAFFGLDAVGDEIEDPFGLDPNDLPLSRLSNMIEGNLRERIGESELAPALPPPDQELID